MAAAIRSASKSGAIHPPRSARLRIVMDFYDVY
jgi:hypothetical protein